MPGKYDQTTQGPGQTTAVAGQGAEAGQRILAVLDQIAAALVAQNRLLELIQGDLHNARTLSRSAGEFPPGSAARNAADVFNSIARR